jgi:hypothetical protein
MWINAIRIPIGCINIFHCLIDLTHDPSTKMRRRNLLSEGSLGGPLNVLLTVMSNHIDLLEFHLGCRQAI